MSRTLKIIGIVLVVWAVLSILSITLNLLTWHYYSEFEKNITIMAVTISLLINVILLVVGVVLILTNRGSIEKCADCKKYIDC